LISQAVPALYNRYVRISSERGDRTDPSGVLTSVYRYPIKSCRGHPMPVAVVEPWGLAGDRRWMVIDDTGEAITARQQPRLVLVTPETTEAGLLLHAPGAEPLSVRPPAGQTLPVSVFSKPLPGVLAEEPAHAWFSALLGIPARLVYLADPTQRRPSAEYSRPTDRVMFADGYPLLLTTEESLAELNRLVLAQPDSDGRPLPMARFRPNLVVTGAPAWTEDFWRRLRIGEAEFRAVKACPRCVLTTVDPETAARGKEPLRTLAQHRRWAGKTWFGMNLIPDTPGAKVRVGDPVAILESATVSEPPR
jgi:uncharacterized protein YcbX